MMMLIDRAIEEFMKHDPRKDVAFSEGCIVEWFESNHKSLGFDSILKKQWNRTPDFIALKDGKEVKVEIEFMASDFLKHGHKTSEADVVVCCTKDVELKGVEVIPLNHIFINYRLEIYPNIDPLAKEYDSDELRDVVDMWNKKPKKEQK